MKDRFQGLSVVGLAFAAVFANVRPAGSFASVEIGFAHDTHSKLTNNAFANLSETAYPDLFKFKSEIVSGSTDEGITGRGSHRSPNGQTVWWYGNELVWRDDMSKQYALRNFNTAYNDAGFEIHLVQDFESPAHQTVTFHGLTSPYAIAPPGTEMKQPPVSGFHNDGFESFVSDAYHNGTAGDDIDKGANSYGPYPDPGNLSCLWRFWLTHPDAGAGAPDFWGDYGKGRTEDCAALAFGARTDWFSNSVPGYDLEIAQTQLYKARTNSVARLKQISEALPPLPRELTLGGAGGGAPAVINSQSGSAFSFKISENRSQSVSVNLYVQGDGRKIITEAATVSLAAGSSASGSNESASIAGPVTWNAKSVSLFNTNDTDASLLPREASFQTSWKGLVSGGDPLADGTYALCLKVSDGDGNISDCEAATLFKVDSTPPLVNVRDARGLVSRVGPGIAASAGITSGSGFTVLVQDFARDGLSFGAGPGKIVILRNGQAYLANTNPFADQHEYTLADFPGAPASLPDGVYTVQAFDQAGNQIGVDFKVDATSPKVTVKDSRGTLAAGGPTQGRGIFITGDDRLGADGRVAPIVSGISKVEIFKNGVLLGSDIRLYDASHTYSLGDLGLVSLPEGQIVVNVTDKVGNVGSARFKVDLTPPTIGVANIEGITIAPGGLTDSPYIAVTGNDALSGVYALSVFRTDGSTVSGPITFGDETGTVGASFTDLADSEPGVSYVVRAEDHAGNVTDFLFRVRHAPKVTLKFLATFDYDYFFEYYGASVETFTVPYSTLTITYRDAFGISAFDLKRNGVSVYSMTYSSPVVVDTPQLLLEDGDYTFTVDTPRGQSTSGAFSKYTLGLQPVLTRSSSTVTLEDGEFKLHFPIVCYNSGPPGTGLGPLAIRPVGVVDDFHVFQDSVATVSCGGNFDGPLANGLYALVGSDHGFDVESFFEIDTQPVSLAVDYKRGILNQINTVSVDAGTMSVRLSSNGFTPEKGTTYWPNGSADTRAINLFQSTDTFVAPYDAIGAALLEPLPRGLNFAASYSNFNAGLESPGDTGLSQAWAIAVDTGPFLPVARWKLFFSTRAAECGTDNGVPITTNCPFEFDFRLDQTRPPMMLGSSITVRQTLTHNTAIYRGSAPGYVTPFGGPPLLSMMYVTASTASIEDRPRDDFAGPLLIAGLPEFQISVPRNVTVLLGDPTDPTLIAKLAELKSRGHESAGGSIALVDPPVLLFKVPAVATMRFDPAVAAARGMAPGDLALYQAEPGGNFFRVPNQVLNVGQNYISAPILRLSERSLFGIFGPKAAVAAPVVDVQPPRTSLSAGAPRFVSGPTVFVASATPIGFTTFDDKLVVGDGLGVGAAQTFYAADDGVFSRFTSAFALVAEGTHTVSFFSVDGKGNAELTLAQALAVDRTPPSAALVSSRTLFAVDAVDPAVRGEASGVAEVRYLVDVADPGACDGVSLNENAPRGTCANPIYAGPFPLGPGSHTIAVRAIDNVGNEGPWRFETRGAAGGLGIGRDSFDAFWSVIIDGAALGFARANSAGVLLSSAALADAAIDLPWSVFFDPGGRAYAIGGAFGPTTRAVDLAVYKASLDGAAIEARTFFDSGHANNDLVFDSRAPGWIVGAAQTSGPADLAAAGSRTFSLALWRFEPAFGTVQLQTTYARAGFDVGTGLAADDDGSLWIAGYSLRPGAPSVGGYDLALWHYAADGRTVLGGPFLRPGYLNGIDGGRTARVFVSSRSVFVATPRTDADGGTDMAFLRYDKAAGRFASENAWRAAGGSPSYPVAILPEASGLLVAGGIGAEATEAALWRFDYDGAPTRATTVDAGGAKGAVFRGGELWLAVDGSTALYRVQSEAAAAGAQIDLLPPRTSLSTGEPLLIAGSEVFVSSAAPLGFTVTDDNVVLGDGLGVGATQTFYAVDGTTYSRFAASFFLVTEGTHTISFFSVDRKGNAEQAQVRSLSVDRTPPQSALSSSGTSYSIAAVDPVVAGAMSGVAAVLYWVDVNPASCGGVAADAAAARGTCANPAYAGPFGLTSGQHTVYFKAIDAVGNVEFLHADGVTVSNPDALSSGGLGIGRDALDAFWSVLSLNEDLAFARANSLGALISSAPLQDAAFGSPWSVFFDGAGRAYAIGVAEGPSTQGADVAVYKATPAGDAIEARILFDSGYANNDLVLDAKAPGWLVGAAQTSGPVNLDLDGERRFALALWRFDPALGAVSLSTTSARGAFDVGSGVAVDPDGSLWIAGYSQRPDAPAARGFDLALWHYAANGRTVLGGPFLWPGYLSDFDGTATARVHVSGDSVYIAAPRVDLSTGTDMAFLRFDKATNRAISETVWRAGAGSASYPAAILPEAAGLLVAGGIGTGESQAALWRFGFDGALRGAALSDAGGARGAVLRGAELWLSVDGSTFPYKVLAEMPAAGSLIDISTPSVPTALGVTSIAPASAQIGTNILAAVAGTGFNASTALSLERADVLRGTWTATGALAQARYASTLTKLRDGRVLAVGGTLTEVNGSKLTSADLYDPATGSWTAAPPLRYGRFLHASVMLADGRVLVTGGSEWPYNSVEIYDPALSTWTMAAPMAHGRSAHEVALLSDGRVLAASGFDGLNYMSSAEIYDPVANAWSAAPAMSAARRYAKMVALSDGKIMIAGGEKVASAEIYDFVANAWTPAGTMRHTRQNHQIAVLPDGKILVSGGWGPAGAANTADVYDPVTNAWTATAPMGVPRGFHAMTLVNGTPLVIGGENSTGNLASTELYDAHTNAWRAGPALRRTRSWPNAVTLDDGRVLVTAGLATRDGGTLNTAELLNAPAAQIAATGVTVADAQHLSGTFNLSDAATGYWDVIVRESDGRIGRLTGGFQVTPVAPTLASIAVTPASASILAGTTVQFAAAGTYSDGSTRTLTGEVVWSTDVSSVATVSTAGMATGVGSGIARVIASSGAIAGRASLTVAVPALTVTSIAPSSAASGTSAAATIAGTGFDASAALSLERSDVLRGTWTATGSFATARIRGTMTRLRDGRVLLAGGRPVGTNWSNAVDIYDPATGSWTAGPPLKQRRSQHAAVLMADGRVLVVGGVEFNAPTTVEIYDPALGTWTAAAPIAQTRKGHAMARLPDGRVLVTGGENSFGSETSSAEIYDPAANAWSPASAMSVTRFYPEITTLSDGKIMVAGGRSVATAEIYDSNANAWMAAGTMSHARYLHQIATLPGGKVMAAGGWGPDGLMSTVDMYDPATNMWTAAAPMAAPRGDYAMVVVNGMPLVIGGQGGPLALGSIELYDAPTNAWRSGPSMTTPRLVPHAVTLADGRVLAAAGISNADSGTYTPTSELLNMPSTSIAAAGVTVADAQHLSGTVDLTDTAAGYWDVVVRQSGRAGRLAGGFQVLPAESTLASLAVTPASASILAGATARFEATGTFSDGSTRTLTGEVVWSIDISSVATVTASGLASGVAGGTALVIASSGAIAGRAALTVTVPELTVNSISPSSAASGASVAATITGTGFDAAAALSLGRSDVLHGTWTVTGALGQARYASTLTKLRDGRVIVAGGSISEVNGSRLASVELYDPATGSWTAGPPMRYARFAHSSIMLADGRVLVTSGKVGLVEAFDSVEIYDPVLGTWTAAAPMTLGRSGHELALLPNGRVLAAGGDGGGDLRRAEIYDPIANAWSAAPAMSTARAHAKMATLSDGRILIAGGVNVATAEIYDSVANAWTPAGTMSHTRQNHQIALLPDGKVLVSGGWGPAGAANTADVYDPTTNAWAATAPMGGRRGFHAMTLVNGTPLVIGGENSTGNLASTELYDAQTNAWRAGPALRRTRSWPNAVTLDDGRVLVTAGDGSIRDVVTLTLNTSELLETPQASVSATGVTVSNAQRLSGTFNLSDAATGYWDVVVRKAGGRVGRLAGGFQVLPAAPTLASIAVTPASASILAGATAQFAAAGTFSDGSTRTLTGEVVWSVDVSSVATVTGSGLATGVGGGTAHVIASSGAVAGQAGLSVAYVAASTVAVGGKPELTLVSTASFSVVIASTEVGAGAVALGSAAAQGLMLVSTVYDVKRQDPGATAILTWSFDPTLVDASTLAIWRFDGIAWSSATVLNQTVSVAGGVGTVTGEVTLTSLFGLFARDVVAPVTTLLIDGLPSGATSHLIASGSAIGFVAADAGMGVRETRYGLDGGPETVFISPFSLTEGTHTLTYLSIDRAGNREEAKSASVAVDATAPRTSLIVTGGRQYPGVGAASFYASSDTRIALTAEDPTVNGVASGLASTEFSKNGGAFQAFGASLALTDGAHSLDYRSRDNVGNLELLKSATVFVDATPPVSAVTVGAPSFTTADGTVHVTPGTPVGFTAADPALPSGQAGAGIERVEVSVDGGVFVPAAGPRTFAEGRHDVLYRALDNVGNVEAARALSIQSDSTPPAATLSISMPASGGYVSGAARFVLTAVDPVVKGAASGVKFVRYRVNGGAFVTGPLDFGLSGPDGAYTLEYQAEDNIGHLEVMRSTAVILDRTPPVTMVQVGASSFTAADGTLYVDPAAPLTLAAADSASGVGRIEASVDGAPFAAYTAALTFAEGRHTVQYRAVDKVGNEEPVRTLSLRSDATPPLTTFVPSGALFTAGERSYAPAQFTYALPAQDPVAGNVASGVALTRYRTTPGAYQNFAAAFSLSEGIRRVEFQSQDNVGNLEVLKGATVFVDATSPVSEVAIGNPKFDPGNGRPVFVAAATPLTLSALDPERQGVAAGVRQISFQQGSAPLAAYSAPFTLPLPDGAKTVEYFAADNVGNIELARNISVALDNTAPATTLAVLGGRQSPGPNAASFYASSDTRLALPAVDPTVNGSASGLALTRWQDNSGVLQTFSTAFGLSEGSHLLAYQSSDRVQNLEVPRSTTVLVDATPPASSVSIGAPAFTASDGVIYIAPATPVTLSAVDPALPTGQAGSGVSRVEVAIDGGSFSAYSTALTFAEGRHTILYRAVDNVGNVEVVHTLQVRSDATPPISSLAIGVPQFQLPSVLLVSTRTPFEVAAVDPVVSAVASGVKDTSFRVADLAPGTGAFSAFTAPFTLAGADVNKVVEFYSRDNVLTAEAVGTKTVLLDSTPPEVALLSPASCGAGICRVLKGRFPVLGTARDPHFGSFRLEFAAGQDAATGFVLISSGAHAVGSATLGTWDATKLSGWLTLRLAAADLVANAASISLNVFVGDPGQSLVLGNHEVFDMPEGVAAGGDGKIYVADRNNDRIAVFSSTGALLASLGGRKDDDDDDEDGNDDKHKKSTATLRLNKPSGVAVDAAGDIYVADTNRDRVLKLSSAGQVLLTLGRRKRHDEDERARALPGQFQHPAGVAVDAASNIYVADTGNRRVQVFSSTGAFSFQFSLPPVPARLQDDDDGDDENDEGRVQLGKPSGIAVDAAGNIYVADSKGGRALRFSAAGQLLLTIPIPGEKPGRLGQPYGVAVSTGGDCLLVSDRKTSRILKFDFLGNSNLVFGGKGKIKDDEDAPAVRSAIVFKKPMGLALDSQGNLFVADRNNNRVQKLGLPTGQAQLVVPPPKPGEEHIARDVVDTEDGGKVERSDRAAVDIPAGAVASDLKITVSTPAFSAADDSNRRRAAEDAKLKTASPPVEYGPEGTKFKGSVTLTLPYSPDLLALQKIDAKDLIVRYWNREKTKWEDLESIVDSKTRTVKAKTTHFSLYQVFSGTVSAAAITPLVADATFAFHDAYAFPNPARGVNTATIRMQTGLADSVEVRVYDVSGRKIHSSSNFSLNPSLDDGNGKGEQYTYDHVWDVSGVGSGVYQYVITAKKAGHSDIHKTGRIGIVK